MNDFRHVNLCCLNIFVELLLTFGVVEMELLITLGRDSLVAFQNEASAKLERLAVGASIIKRTFVLNIEEVRDAIFGGRTISYSNRLLVHNGRELFLTRDYRPLRGQNEEIVGMISMGWSRPAPNAQDYSEISAIVSALGSPELPNRLSALAPLAESSPEAPSGSLALARRLRRFLPQQVH
jgi:hypothetical protein